MFILPPSPSPVHRNESIEMLMNWKDSGASTMSDAEVNRLVNDVLLDPDFKLEDLQGFNVARENQRGDAVEKKSQLFSNGRHQHSSSFRYQRNTTRHIFCSRIGLLKIDRCYSSCILVAPCFPLPFLTFQIISHVCKRRRRTGILQGLQLRCFHRRT